MKDENLEQFLIRQGYILIQMARSNVGHFELETAINENKVLLLVDTGANKTVFHKNVA